MSAFEQIAVRRAHGGRVDGGIGIEQLPVGWCPLARDVRHLASGEGGRRLHAGAAATYSAGAGTTT